MKDLIILGAGGAGMDIISIVDAINKTGSQWNLLGFLDDNTELIGKMILGYPVLGSIDEGEKYPEAYFCSSIAHPSNRKVRRNVYDRVRCYSTKFAILIHPQTVVYAGVPFAPGVVVQAGCVFGTNATVREDVHFGYGCNIAHESTVQEHVALGSGVNISSGVTIGSDCYIGAGVSTSHDISILPDTLIGVGTAVVHNLNHNDTWIGVPAVPAQEFARTKYQLKKLLNLKEKP